MSRYLYKKIQNISPESLNFQHSGLKLTTLGLHPLTPLCGYHLHTPETDTPAAPGVCCYLFVLVCEIEFLAVIVRIRHTFQLGKGLLGQRPHIPSIPGMAAVILPIVLRRSALWYIQIKFSSSTVKCIIPHTSNSFFLVLAAAFFGLVACLLSASCLRIDGRGLRILTSRRSSLLIMAYTPSFK